MLVREIRKIAQEIGIKPTNHKKVSLVRLIQKTEGNFECFATAYDGVCDQQGCMWRDDCLKISVKAGH